jgi:hypothetical protein
MPDDRPRAEQLAKPMSDRVDVIGYRADDRIGDPVIEVADQVSR